MLDKKDLIKLESKATDLFIFVRKMTKIKTNDYTSQELNNLLIKMNLAENINEIKTIITSFQQYSLHKTKKGFSKSHYKLYGEEMRKISQQILENICLLTIDIDISNQQILLLINDTIKKCLFLHKYFYFCSIDEDQILSKKNIQIGTTSIKEILDILIIFQQAFAGRCGLCSSPNSDNSNNVNNVNTNGDWNNNNASNSNGVACFDKR